MIAALLYRVQVKLLSRTRAEVTLVPTRVGRWLQRRMRQGVAYRERDLEGRVGW